MTTTAVEIEHTRIDFIVWVSSAPPVEQARGRPIQPRKVVFEDRAGRIRAVVSGPPSRALGSTYISTNFNVTRYDKYRPAPDWVLDLLRNRAEIQRAARARS